MQRQLTVPLVAPQPGGKGMRGLGQQRRRTIAIQPAGTAGGGASSGAGNAAVASSTSATSPRLRAASATKMERQSSVLARSFRIVDPFAAHASAGAGSTATSTQKGLAALARARPAFVSNAIRTIKYSYLSFLPLCLLQEFRRVRAFM